MSDEAPPSPPPGDASVYDIRNILSPRGLGALAGIGVIVAAIAGAFAYTAGWLTPSRLTPAQVVDQLERTNGGPYKGFRRNHLKGICFSGWFDSNGSGQHLSKAQVFAPGRTPVYGRFAIANGQPAMPDMPGAVFSMALNFTLRDGELWRTGNNDIPVFPVRTTREFTDQLIATTPDPKTGKPDPARVKAFMASHPATLAAIGLIKAGPFASGFADATYNSLNAFVFVDSYGHRTPVRWTFAAEDPFAAARPNPTKDPNYFFTDLANRMRQGPIRWRFYATVAGPGDVTADPTVPWPANRQQVPLGELTIDRVDDEAHGACRDVTFDPMMLPGGIEGSDDPILSARSAAYASSFRRRSGEGPPDSAVRLPSGIGASH